MFGINTSALIYITAGQACFHAFFQCSDIQQEIIWRFVFEFQIEHQRMNILRGPSPMKILQKIHGCAVGFNIEGNWPVIKHKKYEYNPCLFDVIIFKWKICIFKLWYFTRSCLTKKLKYYNKSTYKYRFLPITVTCLSSERGEFKSTGVIWFNPSHYFCWKCITLISTKNIQTWSITPFNSIQKFLSTLLLKSSPFSTIYA